LRATPFQTNIAAPPRPQTDHPRDRRTGRRRSARAADKIPSPPQSAEWPRGPAASLSALAPAPAPALAPSPAPRASRAAAARAAEFPSPPAFPPSQRPTVPVVRVADAVSLPPGTSDRPLASAHHTRGTTCKHRSVAPALDTFLPHCSAEPL